MHDYVRPLKDSPSYSLATVLIESGMEEFKILHDMKAKVRLHFRSVHSLY